MPQNYPAGIAAACTLAQQGNGAVAVQVFEAGPVLGGRASRGTVRVLCIHEGCGFEV